MFSFIGFLFLSIMFLYTHQEAESESAGEQIVVLSEIRQSMEQEDLQAVNQHMEELERMLQQEKEHSQSNRITALLLSYTSFAGGYLLLVFLYLYIYLIRPFHRLECYANQIAKGNLDIEVSYERNHFFGAFTWAFDHMRKELRIARQNEEQAVRDQKTIIASLAHDIRTPIASIRAYAEGLEANLASTYEQRQRYSSIIMRKCDEVTKLSQDLLLHSVSELEYLEISCKKQDIKVCLKHVLSQYDIKQIRVHEPLAKGELLIDEKRFAQVIENVVSNANKYAPGIIEIWSEISHTYNIHILDHGTGISQEDIPHVFEKLYRGHSEGIEGSGLGLFISRYIMEQMHGSIQLLNHQDGLEVILSFSFAF